MEFYKIRCKGTKFISNTQLNLQKNRDSFKNYAFLTNICKIINGIYVYLSLSVSYRIDSFIALPEIFMHSCYSQIGTIAYSRIDASAQRRYIAAFSSASLA